MVYIDSYVRCLRSLTRDICWCDQISGPPPPTPLVVVPAAAGSGIVRYGRITSFAVVVAVVVAHQ